MKTAIPLFFRRCRGFTLLELVAVISILAVLSISATAMFGRLTYDTAAFRRQLESALAYAQKAAVAERRSVSVSVAANTATFTICSGFNPCGAALPFALPTQNGGSSLSAPSGVTLTSSAANFQFQASGGTDQGAAITLTVTGDAARTLTVEAGTGYVHQ